MVLDTDASGPVCIYVCLGSRRLLVGISAATRGDAAVCRRKTVDVEVSTSRRATRNQHAPCAAGSARQAGHGLRGRHSQLLRAVVSPAHGRAAAALYDGL